MDLKGKEQEVQLLRTSKLTGIDNNPRTISEADLDKLVKDISSDKSFMWSRPLLVNVVNGDYLVYAGNQRLKACERLGWDEVPCIVEHDLSIEVMDSRVVIDNVNFGQFDKTKLLMFDESVLKDLDVDTLFKDFSFDDPNKEKDNKGGGTHIKVNTSDKDAAKEPAPPVHKIALEFEDEDDMLLTNIYLSNMDIHAWIDQQLAEHNG